MNIEFFKLLLISIEEKNYETLLRLLDEPEFRCLVSQSNDMFEHILTTVNENNRGENMSSNNYKNIPQFLLMQENDSPLESSEKSVDSTTDSYEYKKNDFIQSSSEAELEDIHKKILLSLMPKRPMAAIMENNNFIKCGRTKIDNLTQSSDEVENDIYNKEFSEISEIIGDFFSNYVDNATDTINQFIEDSNQIKTLTPNTEATWQ